MARTRAINHRPHERLSEALGICAFGLTAMLILALFSYSGTDPSWFHVSSHSDTKNLVGLPGAFVAAILLQVLGLAAFVPPLCLAFIALRLITGVRTQSGAVAVLGIVLFVTSIAGLLTMLFQKVLLGGEPIPAGGLIGNEISFHLVRWLNTAGAAITLSTGLAIGILLFTRISAGRVLAASFVMTRKAAFRANTRIHQEVARRKRARKREKILERHAEEVRDEVRLAKRKAKMPPVAALREVETVEPPAPRSSRRATAIRQKKKIRGKVRQFLDHRKAGEEATPHQIPLPDIEEEGPGGLPPIALLKVPRGDSEVDEKVLVARGKALEDKFKEFKVTGSVVQIHPGPVVTTYEFKPAPGIKYSRLTSLADDICLGLKAESIRIDRIGGKSTVGIEVPNPKRDLILLRDILASDAWNASSSPLTMCLGKLINGEPFVSDLAQMPHLLIAGATGAGKSVALHSMIVSILYRALPEEVRFVFIDPKTLELAPYDGIPHLLCPVVVDPKLAANALRWATREMERRYKMLARYGVRNIGQFNGILKGEDRKGKSRLEEEDSHLLPYIVVVIDELADLMMVSSSEVEEAITRLAQMARAVGIHLILATQRPSVDVITGVIKANFPARISFRVASKTDSRTILDSNGAEQLLGKGDMLFLAPGGSRVTRVHGPYISERETGAIAAWLKRRGEPTYNQEVTRKESKASAHAEVDDDAYIEAVKLVVRTGQASVSNLQRKLRLGYSRAARLVDIMEVNGIVAKSDGARPRKVLLSKAQFEEMFGDA